MRTISWAALVVCLTAWAPGMADAFCGFYVSGAGADMFNNATQVVLMREGTRTVLSMQNNYQGPPESFAMVVPVPVVLQEENVKTLDKAIFKRVDELAAPRLVEYWEEDPCQTIEYQKARKGALAPGAGRSTDTDKAGGLGVTIEAQFKVGEYDIVILSAKDSAGLDTWLKQEKYQIPQGAEPYLKPYVEAGSKFFVAKVDVKKVKFKDGMADLSPLRFHYDSEEFSLPVRLGLINSAGKQDLIVHILARGKRYEVANYNNVTIPTNLDVKNEVRERFGEFYAALFDATLEKNPGAVVTEYAWDASSCDPCPTPALTPGELATLGEDVLYATAKQGARTAREGAKGRVAPRPWSGGFVLTRLHVRYGKAELANDLVFKEAQPIMGGREFWPAGKLEQGAQVAGMNNFQGRYAIRHEWTGPITCKKPIRGRWGGPPAGTQGTGSPTAATDLAFAPRGKTPLASFVRQDIPELSVTASGAAPDMSQTKEMPAAASETKTQEQKAQEQKAQEPKSPESPAPRSKGGCAISHDHASSAPALVLFLGVLVCLRRARRGRANSR